jgi:small ubiquitin-related modifier
MAAFDASHQSLHNSSSRDQQKQQRQQHQQQPESKRPCTGIAATAQPHKRKLLVIVKGQDGSEMHFKVKDDTPMERLIKVYECRKQADTAGFRFLFNAIRVRYDDTPKSLRMENGDIVDALLEQIGD